MKKIYVEIADTPLSREYGLMNRKKLSENQGMLFKFPYSAHLSFWMKETYIPLDIAFINDDGRVIQIEEGVPLSTRAISARQKCRYALEVNKGWFKDNGLGVGSVVDGIGLENKIAQIIAPEITETPQSPPPDIMINMSFKDILEDANLRGEDLIIIYQKKDGFTLPPKVISPPFIFEADEEGNHNAIVKAWDNQTAGWKSFLIDNIIDIQPKIEE